MMMMMVVTILMTTNLKVMIMLGDEIDCNARKARALDNHAAADDDDD